MKLSSGLAFELVPVTDERFQLIDRLIKKL